MKREYAAITEVSQERACEIIQNAQAAPEELFWLKDGEAYVGIDNTTHDAWTEEFDTKEDCFAWLRGEE